MKIGMMVAVSLLVALVAPQTLPPTAVVDYHQHLFSPAITNAGTTVPRCRPGNWSRCSMPPVSAGR